jgi:hypothetical protein
MMTNPSATSDPPMRTFILAVAILVLTYPAPAQPHTIRGAVLAADSRLPVHGAIVTLTLVSDSAEIHRTWSDTTGTFALSMVAPGTYVLQVNHLAYYHSRRTVTVMGSTLQLDETLLRPRTIPIGEVLVRATPPAVQKADTTEYVADAFKLHRDAQAEDLLMKLPGVSVIEGIVRAGGEEVKQVLVDGRPFFGSDPLIALRNLPADAIERVQVFEKMSDQAEFTGFDDGQSMRTINIVTRESRRRSQFGRASAGYGEGGRYAAAGAGNIFNGMQRISILGQSNNANQQNFSAQDILGTLGGPPGGGGPRGGGEGRPRGGGPGGPGGGPGGGPPPGAGGRPGGNMELANSMIGVQSGISTIHSIGTNYTDAWQSGVQVTGNYFFNRSDNENDQVTHRDYTMNGDTRTSYDEQTTGATGNGNHRFGMRLEVPLDSMNSLLIVPNISYQTTDGTSIMDGRSLFAGGSSSVAHTDSRSESKGYTLSQNLLYRHKFELPGRTLSVDANVSGNVRDRHAGLQSTVTTDGLLSESTQQHRDIDIAGAGYTVRLTYTEPFTVTSQAQVEIQSSLTRSGSDTRTYDEDSTGGRSLDQALSNSYDNWYWSQRAGVSYQIRTAQLRLTVGTSLDRAVLEGERTYPTAMGTRKMFWAVLPGVGLDYSPAIGHHFRVNYRGSTQAPSITQLQDVVDNTNPLFLSGGNPDLRQTYTHSLTARLLETEADRATSRMLMLMVSAATDYIANHVRTLIRDTTLAGGVAATAGSQITTPANMAGYWSVRGNADFGFPLEVISSNLNLNTNASVTHSPGMLNEIGYATTGWAIGGGLSIGTNVSREIDGHISYNATYTTSRSTLTENSRTSYLSHMARLRSTITFWEIVVWRNEASYTLRTGMTGGKSQDSFLWTATVGVKFLAENRGELRLTMYDILDQNRSIGRSVTESYVEDTTNRVLPRYLMLTFEYMWR